MAAAAEEARNEEVEVEREPEKMEDLVEEEAEAVKLRSIGRRVDAEVVVVVVGLLGRERAEDEIEDEEEREPERSRARREEAERGIRWVEEAEEERLALFVRPNEVFLAEENAAGTVAERKVGVVAVVVVAAPPVEEA